MADIKTLEGKAKAAEISLRMHSKALQLARTRLIRDDKRVVDCRGRMVKQPHNRIRYTQLSRANLDVVADREVIRRLTNMVIKSKSDLEINNHVLEIARLLVSQDS